jgi:hypothetical protein
MSNILKLLGAAPPYLLTCERCGIVCATFYFTVKVFNLRVSGIATPAFCLKNTF